MRSYANYTVVDGCFTPPLTLTYPYNRTVGTTLSRFFTSLRDRTLYESAVHQDPYIELSAA